MTLSSRIVAPSLAVVATLWAGLAFSQRGIAAAAIFIAPLLVLAVLHRPAWGLWVLVVSVPYAAAYEGLLFRTGNFVLPALILGGLLLHRLHLRRDVGVLPGGLATWFALFVAWVVFTSCFVRFPDRALGVAVRYSLLFAVLVALGNLWSRQDTRRALLVYAIALIPISAYALLQVAIFGLDQVLYSRLATPQRMSSIYSNPNPFGEVMGNGLVILCSLLLCRATQTRTLRRIAIAGGLLAAILILAGGLLVSFSRSSYVYFAAGLITLALPHRRLRLLAAAATATILVALLAFPIPAWLYSALRLGSGVSYRASLWSAGWDLMQKHPLTGVGAGTEVFEQYRAAYLPSSVERALLTTTGGAAHNVFLTKGAELGWVGLALSVALFAMLWLRIPAALRDYRRGDWVRGAAAAGVVGLTARGLFESGATLGMGHVTDSLNFFLFGLILLWPSRVDGTEAPRPEPA